MFFTESAFAVAAAVIFVAVARILQRKPAPLPAAIVDAEAR
jgi:hypothetical protein